MNICNLKPLSFDFMIAFIEAKNCTSCNDNIFLKKQNVVTDIVVSQYKHDWGLPQYLHQIPNLHRNDYS